MTCQKFSEEWADSISIVGCAPAFDRESLLPVDARKHLAECEDCRRDYEQLRWLSDQIYDGERPMPPAAFAANVVLALKKPEVEPAKHNESLSSRAKWVMILSSIAAAVLVVLQFGPGSRTSSETRELASAKSLENETTAAALQMKLEEANIRLDERAANFLEILRGHDAEKGSNKSANEISQALAALPLADSMTDTAASVFEASKKVARPVKEVGTSAVSAFGFLRVDLGNAEQRRSL